MLRNLLIASVVAVLLAVGWQGVRADTPAAISAGGVTGLDLKSQLEKGLRARRPVEFAYIAQVVQLVESGDLPRSLVDTTFVWARKQKRHPLQYFQFALQSRANALGYSTPDLNGQLAPVSP